MLSSTLLLASLFLVAAGDVPIKLLVRADDMGATHGITTACLQAVKAGVATSVEVIVPGPWFPEAVRLLKEHPQVDVGVHIALTSEWDSVRWRPLTTGRSLTDAAGYLPAKVDPRQNPDEVEAEVRAQIRVAMAALPRVTHMTSHMAVTRVPAVHAIFVKVARELGLVFEPPVERLNWQLERSMPDAQREQRFLELLSSLKPGAWLLVTHPAADTPEMRAVGHDGNRDVAAVRSGILKMLTSARVRQAIVRRGIQLISHGDLRQKAVAP